MWYKTDLSCELLYPHIYKIDVSAFIYMPCVRADRISWKFQDGATLYTHKASCRMSTLCCNMRAVGPRYLILKVLRRTVAFKAARRHANSDVNKSHKVRAPSRAFTGDGSFLFLLFAPPLLPPPFLVYHLRTLSLGSSVLTILREDRETMCTPPRNATFMSYEKY